MQSQHSSKLLLSISEYPKIYNLSTRIFSSSVEAREFPQTPCENHNAHGYYSFPKHDQKEISVLLEEILHRLRLPGTIVDSETYASLLRFCGKRKAVLDGKLVHDHIVKSGAEKDAILANLVMHMYGKCGAVKDARDGFDKMAERNIDSWNFMIGAYVSNGYAKSVLQFCQQMEREGPMPDKVTLVHMLSACASQEALLKGKKIHAIVRGSGFELDVVLGTALVNMYGKCGRLEDARRVFDRMPWPNIVSWNAIIAAYVKVGYNQDALELFDLMQSKGTTPDRVTFISILQACAVATDGNTMCILVVSQGLESDARVATTLINMYSKCGSLEDARRMFDRIQQHNVVLWTVMIAAYTQYGQGMEAFSLFMQMQWLGMTADKVTFISLLDACATHAALSEGKQLHACIVQNAFESDAVVATSLVNMYGKCCSLEDARRIFGNIFERNVISWNTIMSVHAQYGQGKETLEFLNQMQLEGVNTDKVTFTTVLDVCASKSVLGRGKQLHVQIIQSGFEDDAVVATALVNMYGKCGSLRDAQMMFEKTPKPDILSWTAMIAGLAQHGHCIEAFQLFHQMQQAGVLADKVTLVSLLSACSRTGLLDVSCQSFVYTMNQKHEKTLTMTHFDCIIDVLARAGQLDEAEELINIMPFQPTAVTWMTLLATCRNHLDVERGQRVAWHVVELDPSITAPHIILSNVNTSFGRVEDRKFAIKPLYRVS